MKSLLSEAIKIAVNAHDGQFDKGGNAYILHVLKVMHYTKSSDTEIQCIAVLHDVVEDTDVTLYDLERSGMTIRITKAVDVLTKRLGQTAEEYLARILANRDAMIVKLADLRHNSDIRRLKGVTDKDIKRIEKYHKMYKTIEAALENLNELR
jgi:(p)ppGpp synthase/HD superfamily hydrolase